MEHRDATKAPGAASEPVSAPATRLDEAAAMLLAWLVVGLVNAAFVAVTPSVRALGAAARATVHGVAAGQIAALGLATFVAVHAWRRWAPTRRYLASFAIAAASAGIAWWVLSDDLSNFVVGRGELWQFRLAGAVGYGAGMAGMVAGARWLVRAKARLVPLAVGLALTSANHLVIPLDYDGMHVLAALAGATALGAGACGLAVPRPRLVRRAALVLAGTLTLCAVFLPSTDREWAALSVSPGTIVAPFVAELREGPDEVVPAIAPPPSVAVAPVPPSGLGLGDEVGTVLVITVDAMRRDLLLDDTHQERFPTLSRLKEEGVFFRNARSPTPATATTYVSMMTSQYYSQFYHTTRKSGRYEGAIAPFEDDFVSLPEHLRDHDVHTAHASCLHRLVEGATAIGGYVEEVTTPRNFGRAQELTRTIRGILEARAQEERLFLYAHYVDPHAPYNRGGTDGSSFERYLEEVALVDTEIGALRAWLEETGRWKRTLLIVSADHGEAFGEHEHKFHASTVYDEMVAVPLIMVSPHLEHRVVDDPVSLIDLAPTILDWYGIATPATFMGQSLVPLMRGQPVELRRPLVIDSGRRIQAMIFPSGMKAIRDLRRRTRELYDLKKDPGETVNLIDSAPDAQEWHAELDAFFEKHTERRPGYRVPWRRF